MAAAGGISDCKQVGIGSLEGLPSLTLQTITFSAFKDGDLDGLTGLTTLIINDGISLTSLPDLSHLTKLTHLSVSNTSLRSLPDLSQNTQLESITINNNALMSLPDLSQNTQLKTLNVNGNLLTSLPDLRRNTKIQTLVVRYNPLSNLSSLELLEAGGGAISLNETFAGGTTGYTANVGSRVSSVRVRAAAADITRQGRRRPALPPRIQQSLWVYKADARKT